MTKWGDRWDGRRVRECNGVLQAVIDIKPHRSESFVYINQKLDVTELSKYLDEKKNAGMHITYFHYFLALIGKIIYLRPRLNYFIANRHLYEHNEISLGFVAKKTFNDESAEELVKFIIEKEDTVLTISDRMNQIIDKLRSKAEKKADLKKSGSPDMKKGGNTSVDVFAKLPNVIRIPLWKLILFADRHGLIPKPLTWDLIYYSSMIVSNLGSIHCGAIHHNISDFGTASSLLTMGEIKDEPVIVNGQEEIRKIMELGIAFDERIADGYYCAKSINLIQQFLDDPESLEKPIGENLTVQEIR